MNEREIITSNKGCMALLFRSSFHQGRSKSSEALINRASEPSVKKGRPPRPRLLSKAQNREIDLFTRGHTVQRHNAEGQTFHGGTSSKYGCLSSEPEALFKMVLNLLWEGPRHRYHIQLYNKFCGTSRHLSLQSLHSRRKVTGKVQLFVFMTQDRVLCHSQFGLRLSVILLFQDWSYRSAITHSFLV